MTNPSQEAWSPTDHGSLPQYGFGPDFTFDRLLKNNPFLFRVHTPKPRSPFFDDTEPYFVGPKFDESCTLSPESLPAHLAFNGSYSDVAAHMDWTTRSSSPFISTSFSVVWSMWEALRRYHANVKHDIEIAIIDANAVADRAVTALELLMKSTPKERHPHYWRWYRFVQESQTVLVHGSIPTTAVLASIPLLSIIDKLPSYFLRTAGALDWKGPPLHRLAWDYTERKPSYRQFCQDMSARFLLMPAGHRLRDTTAGSVRLAMAFLRPWFHKVIMDDFEEATATVCELAFVIAQWPGQWWARDHREMWGIIRTMVQVLGEEVREKHRTQVFEDVRQLEDTVLNLEQVVRRYEKKARAELSPSCPVNGEIGTPPSCPLDEEMGLPLPSRPADEGTRVAGSPTIPAPPSGSDGWPYSIVETASCFVTGFLFGAFITLCSQRRTIATYLT